MTVHVQRTAETAKATCTDCERRGRRGARVSVSTSNSGGLADYLRRHERHGLAKQAQEARA